MRETELDYEEYLAAGAAKAKYAEIYSSKHVFCFTHSADYDGIFSGEIVRRFFNGKVKLIPINFGDEDAKNVLKKWDFTGADVIICDFCFDDDIMEEIARTAHSLTWLDHHASAIDRMKKLKSFDKFYGIWTTKHSGAYNTWCWFYNNMKLISASDRDDVPEIINIVSKYDTWTFTHAEMQKMMAIQLGMKALDIKFGSELFDVLLYEVKNNGNITYDMYQNLMNQIIQTGSAIDKYNQNYSYHSYERMAFDVVFKVKGRKLVGCALNIDAHSDSFRYVYDKDRHDFCISFHRLGDKCASKWTYGIYIMNDKKGKISAIDIAQHISPSGGGHPSASGATTDELIKELQ